MYGVGGGGGSLGGGSSSSSNSSKYSTRNSNNKSLVAATSASASTTQDKFERFETWLRENGARFEMLDLREYDCTKPSSSSQPEDECCSCSAGNLAAEEKKETGTLYNEGGSTTASDHGESEMRGVHANCHIPPSTVCMSIPRRCLITVEMGQATPIGQAILNSDLDLDAPKHIFLMIYILWDRKVNGRNSFFHPYYDILPQTLQNMPIFWSQEELALLEGSYLVHQIHDRNQAITEDYHAICQIAPLAKISTLQEFKWARMCVCSRNFGLQIDGHRTSALVPHADMLNHYRPRETKWTFDEERQSFTITTLQHIPAGAQVYDSYGQKCNHRFLLNYGFAVEDNRELDGFCPNEVPIELYVSPDDPLFSQKLEFWTRGEHNSAHTVATVAAFLAAQSSNAANSSAGAYFSNPPTPVLKRVRVCVSNNENTRLLFSLLRVLACNRAELIAVSSTPNNNNTASGGSGGDVSTRALFGIAEAVVRAGGRSESDSFHHHLPVGGCATSVSSYHQRSCRDIRHPISLRNERTAMRLLLEVVDRHLTQYPNTLSQDVSDLLDESAFPRFSNKRHAKIQVRGEKEVLHHFAHWARTALDVLDVIEQEIKQEQERTHSSSSNSVSMISHHQGSVNNSSAGSNHNVEVKLTPTGRISISAGGREQHVAVASHSGHHEQQPSSFEYVIRRMEDDIDAGTQHTILRYCADVLGSLRREEFKNLRKIQNAQTQQQLQSSSNRAIGNSNGSSGSAVSYFHPHTPGSATAVLRQQQQSSPGLQNAQQHLHHSNESKRKGNNSDSNGNFHGYL